MSVRSMSLSLLLLILLSNSSFGAIRPSFSLKLCSWTATDIVVVTEGDEIDGIVEVLEVWRGDLKKGEKITIHELAGFKDEKSRVIPKEIFPREKPKDQPTHVTCSRMVLFLIRDSEKDRDGKLIKNWKPADTIWKVRFEVSIIWIESDWSFAFVQEHNPGPSQLTDLQQKESEIKKFVEQVTISQSALIEVENRLNDTSLTPDLMRRLCASHEPYIHWKIFEKLKYNRQKNLPAYRAVLNDESVVHTHDVAARFLEDILGEKACPEFAVQIQGELAFWKMAAPKLKNDPWSYGINEEDEKRKLIAHYEKAVMLIQLVAKHGFPDCRKDIVELRDVWEGNRFLKHHNSMPHYCNEYLKSLK